jgi:hypothetical protein
MWSGYVPQYAREGCKLRAIILAGKPQQKRPLGKHRRRWKNNIDIDRKQWVLVLGTRLIWLVVGACEFYTERLNAQKFMDN